MAKRTKNKKHDFWETLSEETKKDILEGIDQLDKGERIPYEEVMKKIRKHWPFHLAKIELSLKQMKEGEVISNEESDRMIEEWLNKDEDY